MKYLYYLWDAMLIILGLIALVIAAIIAIISNGIGVIILGFVHIVGYSIFKVLKNRGKI